MHVLICGAGIVGLTLAQGCKKHGIPFTIFDKDTSITARTQGWGLLLQWCFDSLEYCLPQCVMDKIETTAVRPGEPNLEGVLPVVDASTFKLVYRVPVRGRWLRVNRRKFRELLLEGIDVQWNKELKEFESGEMCVVAKLKDGSSFSGDILVGADGAHSATRRQLLGPEAEPTALPYRVDGVVSRWRYSDPFVEKVFQINPFFVVACDPSRPTSSFIGLQEILKPTTEGEETEVELLTTSTWPVNGPEDDIKKTDKERVCEIKRRTAPFADPLRSIFAGLPANSKVLSFRFADWIPVPYQVPYSRVVLAGDAAHTMTMYRGEGVNYGILITATLLDHLYCVHEGTATLADAVAEYEKFAREKGSEGVLLSRAALIQAHDFGNIDPASPFVSRK